METLQPKLRFPEFKGNRITKKLGEISIKINSGKTPLGGESVYTEEGILFIRSQNVLDSKLSFDNSTFIDEKTNNTMKNSIVKSNDILLNITGASLGRSCVVPNDFIIGNVNQHVCIIRLNLENNSNYIQSILASDNGQTSLKNLSTGSGREGLNFQSIKNLEVYLPSLEEQTKIANFLSAVDEKLNLLKEKKALLEDYKKGIIQKIFNQEIRFKDDNGNDFEDWDNKTLGECLSFEQPTKYLVNSTDYNDAFETPVLTAGKTFILGYTDEVNGIFKKEELPVIIFDDFTTATQFVDFPFKAKSSAMKILKAKENINIKFVYEAMQNLKFEVGGHGRHWISIYSNLYIDLPCLDEQTKIANFLSAIDDKIELVSNQIQDTQEYKKGLLQQMFV